MCIAEPKTSPFFSVSPLFSSVDSNKPCETKLKYLALINEFTNSRPTNSPVISFTELPKNKKTIKLDNNLAIDFNLKREVKKELLTKQSTSLFNKKKEVKQLTATKDTGPFPESKKELKQLPTSKYAGLFSRLKECLKNRPSDVFSCKRRALNKATCFK